MSRSAPLKNYLLENRVFSNRILVAGICLVLLFGVLIARMYYLQIIGYNVYTTQSEKNRIKIEPIPPTRGLIYDANGVLLAQNKPSHSVALIKEKVETLSESLAKIKSHIEINERDLVRFHKQYNRRKRPFEPVPLKFNLTEAEIARLSVNQHKIPGMVISASLIRHYPEGEALAHTLGYVGRINERDETKIDPTAYAGTSHIGKNGLEAFYEQQLHGKVGHQRVEVNARGRIIKVLDQEKPQPGSDLHLYLDLNTQKMAIQSLGEYKGAVVAIDPNTGGIIALVSQPAFDPNLFVEGIDGKSYAALNTDTRRPLYNRALKGQYPPGSTIKPIVGLAALETNAATWEDEISDPGFFRLDNNPHKYRDWKKQGHGKVDMKKAIVESCDTYFYKISHAMGIDTLSSQLMPFNLGSRTKIDLPGEKPGLLPTREWKRRRHNLPWYPGETLIAGIGQGFMLATPLQLALSTAILANKGKQITPRLVKSIATAGLKEPPFKAPTNQTTVQVNNETHWENIISAMEAVVHSPNGTARKISEGINYRIAGKTGTAQVIGIAQDEEYDEDKIAEIHRDHALFVAFAPIEKPMIAISVIVENGGGGGSTAAPIARKVMDEYLKPRLPNKG